MTFRKLLILSAIIPGLQRIMIMGSGPVSSPAHVRCECGDIGPGNCTALTQPPLPRPQHRSSNPHQDLYLDLICKRGQAEDFY